MLRVVHVTESITASAGGTSTAFVELIEALRTQQAAGTATVRAVAQHLPAGDAAAQWIAGHEPGLWLWTGPPGKLRPGALAARAIGLIERGEVDVIHLHGLWLIDLVAIARAARRRGVTVVWQPHGMLVRDALAHKRLKKLAFLTLGLGRELARCAAAIFTSENERDTSNLALLGRATRREIVPLPVPIVAREDQLPALAEAGRARWLSAEANDPERTLMGGQHVPDFTTPLLVFMGRLHPVKRIELTLRAFALIRQQLPAAKLLLIGSGEPPYAQSLHVLASELGVAPGLLWAGWLSGADKWRALAAGDALMINSEFENFGYAIVEALVAKTPAIMTDNLSLARAVQEIGAGVSTPATPEGLAAGALAVLSRSDRREMGLRGRRWVEVNFSRQAVGTRLVDLYRALRSPVAQPQP